MLAEPEAFRMLSQMCRLGTEYSFEKDMKLYNEGDFIGAKKLFEHAARDGNPAAHFWLGICIHFGFGGIEQDGEKAAVEASIHYNEAAKKGYALAIEMMDGIKNTERFKEYLKDWG